MQEVTPKVHLAGHTMPRLDEMETYLRDIGADQYADEMMARSDEDNPEEILAVAGKKCYKSFQPGLNPNVTKVRGYDEYIPESILKTGHGSVLEHGSVTFIFDNVSRVFTHELVRHRVGSSFSQESLRYVRLEDLKFWMPDALKGNEEGEALVRETIEYLEDVQKKLADIYSIHDEKNFSKKKIMTSAFRRLAPIGLGTSIMWSANFRTLRHVIALRTAVHAEEEIRLVFNEVAEICKNNWPNVFADMTKNDKGEWVFSNPQQPYEKK